MSRTVKGYLGASVIWALGIPARITFALRRP